MIPANGDKDMHFLLSKAFMLLHFVAHMKSDGSSCVKKEKRELGRDVQNLYTSSLAHLGNCYVKWVCLLDFRFQKVILTPLTCYHRDQDTKKCQKTDAGLDGCFKIIFQNEYSSPYAVLVTSLSFIV